MTFKTTFKRGKNGEVSIHFDGMTQGKAIALATALQKHTTAVGRDVLVSLHNAIQGQTSTEFAEDNQELFDSTHIIAE